MVYLFLLMEINKSTLDSKKTALETKKKKIVRSAFRDQKAHYQNHLSLESIIKQNILYQGGSYRFYLPIFHFLTKQAQNILVESTLPKL